MLVPPEINVGLLLLPYGHRVHLWVQQFTQLLRYSRVKVTANNSFASYIFFAFFCCIMTEYLLCGIVWQHSRIAIVLCEV